MTISAVLSCETGPIMKKHDSLDELKVYIKIKLELDNLMIGLSNERVGELVKYCCAFKVARKIFLNFDEWKEFILEALRVSHGAYQKEILSGFSFANFKKTIKRIVRRVAHATQQSNTRRIVSRNNDGCLGFR